MGQIDTNRITESSLREIDDRDDTIFVGAVI